MSYICLTYFLAIFLNALHSLSILSLVFIFDNFFYCVTYLGDGFFAALILIFILLFISVRKSLVITGILLSVSALTQILKLFVFPSSSRPIVFFKDVIQLHFVDGLEIHTSNSFPSGHTTQAFCMFFLFSFFIKNKNWNYVFFLIAALAAISRVYLLQHFLRDIYVGAIIGTLGSVLFLYLSNKYALLSNPALDLPLIKKK